MVSRSQVFTSVVPHEDRSAAAQCSPRERRGEYGKYQADNSEESGWLVGSTDTAGNGHDRIRILVFGTYPTTSAKGKGADSPLRNRTLSYRIVHHGRHRLPGNVDRGKELQL